MIKFACNISNKTVYKVEKQTSSIKATDFTADNMTNKTTNLYNCNFKKREII